MQQNTFYNGNTQKIGHFETVYLSCIDLNCHYYKVQILWEGHKILKKYLTVFRNSLLFNVKSKWEISWNCCGLLRISELSFTDVIRKTSFLLNGQTLDVARKTFKSQRFFHEFKNFYTGSTSHIFTFQDDLTLLYYRVGNEIDFFFL